MPSRKGSPNRPKRLLIARLREEFPDYEPVLEIARAAHKLTNMALEAEQTEEIELRVNASTLWKDAGTQHDKVAQYVTPKLKAIEVTGKDGEPVQTINITREMTPEEATHLYQDLILGDGLQES